MNRLRWRVTPGVRALVVPRVSDPRTGSDRENRREGEGGAPPRVPELDALRGVAVVIVLLFHLDPLRYFPGWSGVDLFFVLSGYLITSIILRDVGSPGFFRTFYVRRALRIWPIYYLVVFGLVALNPFLAQPDPLSGLRYVLTYTQNVPMYWEGAAPPGHVALVHTWTLAIEEQFYLVWPALLAWAGRRRLVVICLWTILISLAFRSGVPFLLPRYPERLLLSRSDGFALGGLLAWAFAEGSWAGRRPDLVGKVLWAMAGLAGLYLAWGCLTHDPLGFIGLPTPSDPAETIFAFSALYAAIIGLVALHAGSRWLAPLRLAGLVYLGQISYGLYLYHLVVYWIYDGCRQPPTALKIAQPWTDQAVKLLIALTVAVASWHLIERPILRLKRRFPYRDPTPTRAPLGEAGTGR